MNKHNKLSYKALLFLLGFLTLSVQVILIRESLSLFHGNELVIGLFLGIWMALTAGGSYFSGRLTRFPFSPFLLLLLLALLPIATLYLFVLLRSAMVPSGVMAGPGQTAIVFTLALLPFCFISGMSFPLLVKNLSAFLGKRALPGSYAMESAGGVLAGILFSLILILVLPPFESLILVSSFSLLAISVISWGSKKPAMAILNLVLGILVFFMPTLQSWVKFIDLKQFNNYNILEIKSTPHGMLAVGERDDHLIIFNNGIPVSLAEDVIKQEESVHYGMLSHPAPRKVLMISGGASGMIKEALKYPVEKIDYIEPNPWLMKLVHKYRPLPDDRQVNYIYQDPVVFLRNNTDPYDVILLNPAEPVSAELNRYYTTEFYQHLKGKLKAGGILSVSLPAAGNYMNEKSREAHSVVYNTLKTAFAHIRIIPGWKDYFLASDSAFDKPLFQNYPEAGFTNLYVDPSYIDEDRINARSMLILNDLLPDAQINSNLKPWVFSLYLAQWLGQYQVKTWLLPLILVSILGIALGFIGPLNLGLFAGGFTSSGLEFILLLWLQVMYGNVYQFSALIFSLFMVGLVLGSLIGAGRRIRKTFGHYMGILWIIAAFAIFIALLIWFIPDDVSVILSGAMIFILVMATGILTGIQFSFRAFLGKSSTQRSSGEAFSADLLGSAIGIILVSVYLVPQFGLPETGMILAGLNVIAGIFILLKYKKSMR